MAIEPSSAGETLSYGPYQQTTFPKWDSLKADGFDVSKYELNYRIEQSTRAADEAATIQTIVWSGVAILVIRALVVWILTFPAVNAALTNPKTFAMWVLMGLGMAFIIGVYGNASWSYVLGSFVAAPAMCLFLSLLGETSGAYGIYWKLLMVVPTFTALGYLVDQVLTHEVYWLSADPKLNAETIKRRRTWWGARLDRKVLEKQTASLVEKASAATAEGNQRLAEAIRNQLTEEALVKKYEHGFWVLVLYAALAMLPRNLWLLVVVPPAIVFLLKFAEDSTKCERVIRNSWNAVVVWCSYGRFGASAPGVFQSPSGPWSSRMVVSFWALLFLAIQVIPAPPVLFEGDASSSTWEWAVLFRLLGGVGISFLVGFVSLVTVGGELLVSLEDAVKENGADARLTDGQAQWEILQSRLRESSYEDERRSLWFGVHAVSGYPILLPFSTMREHMHEVGATGSGKTSRGLAPLMTQFIRVPKDHPDDAAVVILDFKGDRALFENARLEAERKGVKFRYFTNVLGHSSSVFNPVSQLMGGDFSPAQAAQILMASLGLEHGAGYGRSYFSRMGREWLVEILRRFPNTRSFEELAKFTEGNAHFNNVTQKRECGELIAAIRLLAGYPEMNLSKENSQTEEEGIVMSRVLEEREVVYFYLPAGLSLGTIREIGSLALYTAYAAAVARKNKGKAARRCHLLIDEFQIIANKTFEMVIEQARGLGLDLVLSHQSLFDLKTPDAGFLLNVVQSNTRVRRYSSIDDPVVQELISKSSGETVYADAFYGEDVSDPTNNIRSYLGPRISRNDIIAVGADPSLALLHVTRDGMKGPKFGGLMFPIRADFHISTAEYERRERAPWPPLAPGLIEIGGTLGSATGTLLPPVPVSPPWSASEEDGKEQKPLPPPVERPEPKRTEQAPSPWAVRLNKEFKKQFEGERKSS